MVHEGGLRKESRPHFFVEFPGKCENFMKLL